MSKKAIVYVDGFNLYHALKEYAKDSKNPRCYKWLNIHELARRLLAGSVTEIKIRYFTAAVKPFPKDPDNHIRQKIYWRALRTLGQNIEFIFGHFTSRTKRYPEVLDNSATPKIGKTVPVFVTEEKGSDVNLGVCLVDDAHLRKMDVALVLSNDSDLALAIQIAKGRGIEVFVANPRFNKGNVAELKQVASDVRQLDESCYQQSQFPPTLHDARGTFSKPTQW